MTDPQNTPAPEVFDSISDAVTTMQNLANEFGALPKDLGQDIKIVVAGIADLLEHLLSKDQLFFIGQFQGDVSTALNTLLNQPQTVSVLLNKVEQAFQNVAEGRASIARIESLAARCDAASMGLVARFDIENVSLFASKRHDARLMAERDVLIEEAMILPGMASAYGLESHLVDFAEDLATRSDLTGEALEDELALVQMTRRRVSAAEVGVSVAGSVSTGGDVSAYLGIGGSIGVGLAKFLANVDARLHRYETLLTKAVKSAA